MIVKKSLLGNAKPICPTVMNWKTMADNESMPNTPPCYAIYMCGLNFDYIKRNGGIAAFKALAEQRSQILYTAIDGSDGFYVNKVNPAYRSRTNIPFVIQNGNAELEAKFITEATAQGLLELKGHRSVGGLRASIYNGMPMEGVQKLVDFMAAFKANNSS